MNTISLSRFPFFRSTARAPRTVALKAIGMLPMIVAVAIVTLLASYAHAVDLVSFSGLTASPLYSSLTQLAALGPGMKALCGFIAFSVGLFSLVALRNFGQAVMFIGVAIYGSVGLVVGGAIMGAVI